MKFYKHNFSTVGKQRLLSCVKKVLDTGEFINGSGVRRFEETMSKYFSRSFVSCNSGTDALVMALEAIGVGPGDEVITTGFTFFATIDAIYRVGAKPVVIDIDLKTFNIDPRLIERHISKKTKAVLIVHLFGLSCEMEAITKICRQHKLLLVEDTAQSFGAKYKGRLTGTFGDTGCFSFFPTKNLGGFGDGGGITAKNKNIEKKIRSLANHGQTKRYVHSYMGYNSRLDTLQAELLIERFLYLEEELLSRRKRAKKLINKLRNNEEVIQLPEQDGHTYNQFSILVKDRNKFVKDLKNTPSMVYYPLPVYRQPAFIKHYGRIKSLPNCEFASKHILSLPIYN